MNDITITSKFTLEEIYLIKSCNTKRKDSAIRILKRFKKEIQILNRYRMEKYVNNYDAGMAEIIHNTLGKLRDLPEQDFIELIDYPI